MKNALMVPLRKKSLSHSVVDLRLNLAPTPAATTACGDRQISAHSVTSGGAEVKTPDSPRQPTMSLPSEAAMTESIAESASDPNATKDGSASVRGRRGSATMRSFLQRVMRSQSDCHIRIAPLAHSEANGSATAMTSVTDAALPQDKMVETRCNDLHADGRVDNVEEDSAVQVPVEGDVEVTQDMGQTQTSEELLHEQHDAAAAAGLCDAFLNSSLQLLQVQSDAKQRVRQLWTCAQKLRWENQLSDSGLESLHHELLAVMKALTVEKLEGPRHIKAGYLTLVQAPPAVVAANLVHRGVAAATKSLLLGGGVMKTSLDQRVWVSLSEEQCRMELVPYERPAPSPTQPAHPPGSSESTPASGTAATFPKFKLPTSISWLLSDPSQAKDDDTMWIGRTAIKLQGCQVRRMPTPSGGSGPVPVRFQVLVPTSDPSHLMPSAPVVSTAVVPDQSLASSYGVYVFEIPLADSASAEHERDEWIRAIDRVCVFHLYALEHQLREACFMLQFRDVLASSFPVTVPLTWLRNRLEKMPSATATMSAQQHAQYQYQQLQRRSSRNLSMVQIVKDLERDRILVDKKVLISCMGPTPSASGILCRDDSSVVEHDSVAEIVKYLVAKAMAFAHTNTKPVHTKPARASLPHGKPPVACSPSSSSSSSSGSDPQGLMSPSSRLAKFTEARALAFVERVLRGSSRTQSGGDIYDAISFFCQQRHLMICPMSHDAHPVQLNVLQDREADEDADDDEVTTATTDDDSGDASFQIEIEVSMQFKVVEMPAMVPPRFDDDAARCDAMAMASPRDWAVLEGTLRRQFTLGKLSEPGSVTVKYIPDPECPHPQ